jgi:hypothetical protein
MVIHTSTYPIKTYALIANYMIKKWLKSVGETITQGVHLKYEKGNVNPATTKPKKVDN